MRPRACLLARNLASSRQLIRFVSTSATRPGSLSLSYDLWKPQDASAKGPLNNPIVFMHGLFGSKKNNRTMSKVLARELNRPVYAIDLRNHGDSPHNPVHNYDVMAQDVEDFIQEHKLQHTTLIGHSMGAKVAMALALKNPEIVENCIPVDNAPIDASLKNDFGNYVKGMRRIEEAKVTKQSEADEILQEYEPTLTIRQFLLTNLVHINDDSGAYRKFRIPLKTLAMSLDHMADFPYKDPDQMQYKKPTLIIRGTKSHYVSDETLPIIGRFFPRFELRDIDAHHWLISEQPMAFRDAVVDFLADKP